MGGGTEPSLSGATSYADIFDDYLAYIGPRLEHAHRLLTADGTLYFHIDYREAHYCKILLDQIFGRDSFINEIIWAYDYGGRSRRRWPAKHDTILVYAKDPDGYFFDQEAIERIPYMAPGLVSKEKAARGKLPTDVWWHTIVATNGKEKTGYATQKPEGILKRILSASSQENDWVLDFFAGSGTTGAVAQQMNRRFVMIDNNDEAISVMARASVLAPLRDGIGTLATPTGGYDYGRSTEVELASASTSSSRLADSPFGWIKTQASRRVGKIGEQLVAAWCTANFGKSPDRKPTESSRVTGSRSSSQRLEVRLPKIRDQDYDFLFALGISPYAAHAWVLPKSILTR